MSLSFAVAILSSIVTSSAAQSATPASAPSPTPGISLAINAEEKTVKSGSPVKLVVALTNQLDHDIVFGYPQSEQREHTGSTSVMRRKILHRIRSLVSSAMAMLTLKIWIAIWSASDSPRKNSWGRGVRFHSR